MKKNNKITFCAMMSALACVVMLTSYFPYLTYAIPAMAGLFIMIAVIEIGKKWAFLSFVSSAVIVFMIAEPEAKLMYIGFLGYYPILKALIERLRKPVLEWVLKFITFNIAVMIIYCFFASLFDISFEDFGALGKYGVYITLGVGNIVFAVYDIAVARMAMFYNFVVRPKIKKFLK